MIVNVPTPEGLNDAALKAHFLAWELLVEVFDGFDDFHHDNTDPSEATWNLEFRQYLNKSIDELNQIYAFMAQANELALKSRIANVSPFLLLFGSGSKGFRKGGGDIDFSDLRTIDAVDLPAAVNNLTDDLVSEEFVVFYSKIRYARNKMMHLGAGPTEFEHNELISELVFQYDSLWRRHFFVNWIRISEHRRFSHFFSSDEYNAYSHVISYVPFLSILVEGDDFTKMFGSSPRQEMFLCPNCLDRSLLRKRDVDLSQYKTAFLDYDGNIHCPVCESATIPSRRDCEEFDCSGYLVFSDNEHSPTCLTCGRPQVER